MASHGCTKLSEKFRASVFGRISAERDTTNERVRKIIDLKRKICGEGPNPPIPQVTFLTSPIRPALTKATACRNRFPDSVRCMVPT